MEDFLIKVDKNGTKYWGNMTCPRCGGAGGADQWAYTGWTCYECGGSGQRMTPYVWKEYTPEYQAKLDARRKKAHDKKIAEQKARSGEINQKFFQKNGFNAEGKTYIALGDTYKVKDELKEKGFMYARFLGWHSPNAVEGVQTLEISADDIYSKDVCDCYNGDLKKHYYFNGELLDYEDFDYCDTWHYIVEELVEEANDKMARSSAEGSEWIGAVGDKVEVEVIIEKCIDCEFKVCRGVTNTSYLYILRDNNGNWLKWKASSPMYHTKYDSRGDFHYVPIQLGETVKLKGTIKELSTYGGVKQTVLTRCKVVEE